MAQKKGDVKMKLQFKTGTPPHKGYYLVRYNGRYRTVNLTKDKYPMPLYWNGKTWQFMSDDDEFEMPGDYKATEYMLLGDEEWCEVEV